jgi:hypothetical protein
MNFRNKRASCEEVRNVDLVYYLSSLGYEPAKIRNANYWYLSPLRQEKTPSFKVARNLNRWYDHGLGKGGNLIDFAILYHDCTVGEFLQNFGKDFPLHHPLAFPSKTAKKEKESRIIITSEKSITSPFLFHYLTQRRIPWRIAVRYCKEVTFELCGRTYYAIAFKNDSGGYELRNSFFKGSSAPKDFTSFDIGANEVDVFEGLFDFLSFLTIQQNVSKARANSLVLNSTGFFEKARPFMERHEVVNLYLDRDKTGQNCTRYALSLNEKYKDKSIFYDRYSDLNDWIVNIGKSLK